VFLGWVTVLAALAVGAFGVLNQKSNGTILGYPVPYNTQCFGTFMSRNHAGVYLYLHAAIALGLTFWHIRRAGDNVLRGGPHLAAAFVAFALGLPGGLRIFPSAFQAILNLVDHGMTLQEAVEAPRIWTEGGVLEIEDAIPDSVAAELRARGHEVVRSRRIAGGMNAIGFGADGMLTGAACWRADGTPVAVSGGLARAGVRFTI